MKRIELKTPEGAEPYRDRLEVVLKFPSDPSRGLRYDEIRTSMKLLDKLDEADGVLLLEDEEHKQLCARLKAAGWTAASRDVLNFLEDVLNAPDVKVEAER